MKQPEKQDSDNHNNDSGTKKPSSFPIPSASSTARDKDTAFDIPSAESAPQGKKQVLKITRGPKTSERDDQTSFDINAADIPELDGNDTSYDINAADIPGLDENDTSYDINAADIPELNKSDTADIPKLSKSKTPKYNKSMEDTDDLDDEDIPERNENKPPKYNKSMEETDGLDKDEIEMALSSAEEDQSLKYSYHESDSDEDKSKTSIIDLLNHKEIEEKDITDTDSDITETLSGKSLDEILKTSQKKEEEFHESKNESISERKKQQISHKKLKIILGAAIGIIAIAAIVLNIVKVKLNTPEQDQSIDNVSFDKLKIPKNLKDQKKLNAFLTMGINLYNNEKYADAESILKKLLRTKWNSGLINGILGDCRIQQKDEKGAADYYRKSVQSGYTEKVDFAIGLAKILNQQKNYPEVISTLEPYQEKYASNQEMQTLLSIAYYNEGDMEKTLECYNHINPSLLPEKQLNAYAKLLEKKGNKQEAFKIYLTLGKVYSNTQAYIKAEELAPDEKTRLSILAQIVGKTANTPQGVYYNMRFGIKMFNAGQRREGLQVLKAVNTDKLNKKDATEFLKMLPYFEGEKFLIQEALSVLTKHYSDNVEMHEELKEALVKEGKEKFCEDFFKKEYSANPQKPIPNYMYASFQPDPKLKMHLYQKAIALSPNFFEANLALGIFYINEQNWKEASSLLTECEHLKPESIEAKYYSTIVKIKATNKSTALKDYENFLKGMEKPNEEIFKQMVLLSQYMKDDKYALIYLNQAEKLPSLKSFCSRESIKIKLIYGTIKESDFTDLKDPVIKRYYKIFLFSKGEFREIMSLPTNKEEFPDFWKVLVGWEQEIPSWENNAHLIINRKKDDILVVTSAKMWLRMIKPANAALLLDRIDYIEKPLLCMLIAEQYRKDRDSLNSRIFFRKALTYSNPNIYVKAIEYLKKHK